jgi:protein SCO1
VSARRLHVALWIGGALPLALLLYFVVGRPVQVLPRLRPLPAFSLQDQQGGWLADSELRGRAVLVSFGYSRCGDACAATSSLLRDLAAQPAATPLLLTVDLDAAYDTLPVLQRYATALGADGERWRLLRGEPAEIKALVGGGLGIYYTAGGEAAAPPPTLRDHRVLLIDGQGLVRAEYAGVGLDISRVRRDLALVEREAASQGPTRLLYSAAHLFVCYPD